MPSAEKEFGVKGLTSRRIGKYSGLLNETQKGQHIRNRDHIPRLMTML